MTKLEQSVLIIGMFIMTLAIIIIAINYEKPDKYNEAEKYTTEEFEVILFKSDEPDSSNTDYYYFTVDIIFFQNLTVNITSEGSHNFLWKGNVSIDDTFYLRSLKIKTYYQSTIIIEIENGETHYINFLKR